MLFEDIKNQDVLSNRLSSIIDEGRVSHAQLFLGDSRSGCLAMAIAYMQYACCQHPQHYEALDDGRYRKPDGTLTALRADSCGVCPSCRKFATLQHPDLHFVFPNITTGEGSAEKASSEPFLEQFRAFLNQYHQCGTLNQWYDAIEVNNKQGLIREKDADNIVNYVSLTPYEAPYKMILIWHAEKMNTVAANTLLKTIEEPSGRTLIILTAESTERMLETIISRVQKVRVPEVATADMVDPEFAAYFVRWMRMLFKLDMAQLSAWTDEIAKLGRERQKHFLLFCLEALRVSMMRNISGGTYPNTMPCGDDKFDNSFYAVITPRNIGLMNDALNHTLMAIERNASPALAFMQLSFKLSTAIKKK